MLTIHLWKQRFNDVFKRQTTKSLFLQMYSLDGRLSLQSLSEYDSSRSWIAENAVLTPTPPPPEDDNENLFYMGVCLPRKLLTIFPEPPQPSQPTLLEDSIKSELETTEIDEESSSECDADTEHCRTCLVCYHNKSSKDTGSTDHDIKLRRYRKHNHLGDYSYIKDRRLWS